MTANTHTVLTKTNVVLQRLLSSPRQPLNAIKGTLDAELDGAQGDLRCDGGRARAVI